MSDKPIELDSHRGMAAQHETELRRLVSEVEANEAALRTRQEEIERRLLALPAESWPQAADKARYLLGRYAATAAGGDARTRQMIAAVIDDFERLAAAPPA
ncbi:MAG: hypothetical protein EPO67_07885 [Reyranella sp.]|nr:MAG: hypothetical protein EPO67_07885 [Reyranella sp.]